MCYQPLIDSSDPKLAVSVLGRYTIVLTGSAPPTADASEKPLSQIQALSRVSPQVTFQFYVLPLMQSISGYGYKRLKTKPETPKEIAELWPFMIGGCKDVEVSFSDGRTRTSYATRLPAGAPAQWITPQEAASRGMPAGMAMKDSISGAYYVIWTAKNKADWPRAIRMKMTMVSNMEDSTDEEDRTKDREYELIFSLP